VDRAERLNDQIRSGRETLLLLVTKAGALFRGFQAPILSVHLGQPSTEILRIAPPYYANFHENPRLWFVVGSPFLESQLTKFRLLSNDRPLLDVVRETRTSSMLIHQES
jgi:hypothetical protein